VISVKTPSAMLIATTCNELRPLALSADAASGVASIDSRSDCKSSSLVCATTSSTFERVVEARASDQEAAIRPMLICGNHTRSIDALDLRDCIERAKPQKRSVDEG
jgi:hypothetical protein